MFVPFGTLPDSARIWIYPANRPLSEEESIKIQDKMQTFLTQWTAHGTDLQAGFKIIYKRFLVIALNEALQSASGCSIDASVRCIQEIEQEFNLTLLDKMNVTFRQGEYLAYKPLSEFKKLVKNRSVSKDTIVFNNLVLNKKELETLWEVPAQQSWHARFF